MKETKRPRETLQGAFRNELSVFISFFILLQFLAFPAISYSTDKPDRVPEEAGIDQNLDAQIDLNLAFTNFNGQTGPLSTFLLPGRPTIIVPVYYGCPRLCGYTLQGLVTLLNTLDFKLGEDFKVLAVSFDPSEGPNLAAKRAAEQFSKLTHPERGDPGWGFLTGNEASVHSLMTELGFHFKKDGEEYSHAAGLMIITPAGKIARYFFGITFPSTDVRYSLIEASQGKIGGIIDHAFLYCFRFDPTKGKYSIIVFNITRIICGLFAIAIGVMLVGLKIKFR